MHILFYFFICRFSLKPGVFKDLLDQTKTMSPDERGMMLTNSSNVFNVAHQELSLEGQTEANPQEAVNHHFVAFIHKEGHLYELDGRKPFPINHGTTTPDTLLEDSAKICKEYMARDSEDVNFTIMALAAAQN